MQLGVERDFKHLRWLSVFHYMMAAIVAVLGWKPMLYVGVGIGLHTEFILYENVPPPDYFDPIILVLGLVMTLPIWFLTIMLYFLGRSLIRHRHYTFCNIVAGLECLLVPVGTILGLSTMTVLDRESVRQLFGVDRSQGEIAAPFTATPDDDRACPNRLPPRSNECNDATGHQPRS